MNLPPNFTDIGGQSLADSTTRAYFTVLQGLPYNFTITASDPADPVSDPLTHVAYYLQLGMAFDPGTRTFSWTPPAGTVGQTFHVRFAVTTPSGGTDAIIAVISVAASLGPGSRASVARPAVSLEPERDGFVQFKFLNATQKDMQLTVFDLAGRRIVRLEERAGRVLRWDGRDETGKRVASGVYLYRIRMGGASFAGRLVYLR
jgi:multidrug efflux pump subunit AcrA (membrane-fusion protein)